VTSIRADIRADTAGCRILDWDSDFFGRRIARVESSCVAASGMCTVDEWCAEHGVECAYLLIDSSDQPTCALAQTSGFKLVDVRVTPECALSRSAVQGVPAAGPVVRVAKADDLEQLEVIAGESHRETRFYMDGRFDKRRCDDLYRLWIAKSCRGWADRVLVVEMEGSVVGYLTCHLNDRSGRIGLVAVSTSSRGKGAGSALMDAAHCWFREANADRISVVTQGRNSASLRLYQRAGMTVTSIQLWFHKWW
jgi:dTDP-4-amino-4,6-dideoxy-D-galactose acyltransferase